MCDINLYINFIAAKSGIENCGKIKCKKNQRKKMIGNILVCLIHGNY